MLRICMPTSEFAPFAKTGGLADVTAGLSDYLSRIGQDVRVFLPFYRSMATQPADVHAIEFLQDITVEMGWRELRFGVHAARVPDTEQWIYLIKCPELYDRDGFYCADNDEHIRFAFFSRAVIQTCQHMGWAPHVFHLNDWHTALLPLYLKTIYGWDAAFERSRSMLTIHNIGYQGVFSADTRHELGLGPHESMLHQDDLQAGQLSFMKHGIIYADLLTTVSRTYGHELQTEEFGMGLHRELAARRENLIGIVNGVDYAQWNPESDPLIGDHFSADDPGGKARCRAKLLEALDLEPDPAGPVLGAISRLTWQKGFELMYETLPEVLDARDVRVAILGSGEQKYEEYFLWLQQRYPGKVCFWRGYNNELAHQIEAGADIFLMPSRFEPCGLNQMYSLKYGTVPIVRKTGGLADTVRHWDPATGEGNGFVFEHFTAQGLRWALGEALRAYDNKDAWRRIMRNGMAADYSWDRQGREYLRQYARLAGI